MALASGRCHYHPERSGIGICVECRSVICTECTTQFEGINRCAKCLADAHARLKKVVTRVDWSAGNVMLSLVAIGILFTGFFFTFHLFTP
jgi:hypothetical protein